MNGSRAPFPYILPVEETVQHKTDVLDRELIAGQNSDLDFRRPVWFSLAEHLAVLGQLGLASLTAGLVTCVVSVLVAPHLLKWRLAMAALVVGVLAAALHVLHRLRRPIAEVGPLLDGRTAALLAGPLYAWLAVALTAHVFQLFGAFLYLMAVSLPALLFVEDDLATHAVYWMTARKRFTQATKEGWRDDWRLRFRAHPPPRLPCPPELPPAPCLRILAVQCRRDYRHGPAWLISAIVWPSAIVLATSPPEATLALGRRLTVGILAGLAIAGLARSRADPRALARFWHSLVHWFHYHEDETCPWEFHSPAGPRDTRRLLIIVAVSLVAVPIVGLWANPWCVFMTRPGPPAQKDRYTYAHAAEDSQPRTLPSDSAPPESTRPEETGPSFAGLAAVLPEGLTRLVSLQGLTFLVSTTLCLLIVPAAIVLLAGSLLTGPLLLIYHNVLER